MRHRSGLAAAFLKYGDPVRSVSYTHLDVYKRQPNDRYMNDEQIAQAVAGYLEKVGIKVNLNLMPKANFFSYIKPFENKSCLLYTSRCV